MSLATSARKHSGGPASNYETVASWARDAQSVELNGVHYQDSQLIICHSRTRRRFFHSADFQWHKYADLLRQIRVPHLVMLQSLKSVTADGLIPMGLLGRVVGDQWRALLQSEESPVGGKSAIRTSTRTASAWVAPE